MKGELIPVSTELGEFRVWVEQHGTHPTRKLLLLHGGPGANHKYFKSFEQWMPKEEISWIYYDQLGSAGSDNPDDLSLWNIDRFVDEVEQVRLALGLHRNNFFLLGHSWGGILAIEYALKYQQNLKGLIISNMMASCPEYQRYADEVLGPQMPPEVLGRIKELEASGDYEGEEYMNLLMSHHYVNHVLRLPPEKWPLDVQEAFGKMNQRLYVHMQGPSEFGISGVLADWDRSRELQKITVPSLVVGAEHDTMDPKYMAWMADQMPRGNYLHCPSGSHLAMWDDSEVYHQGIERFIRWVDDDDD